MNLNHEEFFDVVVEPEHSKKILIDFQKKYKYDSFMLYTAYVQGLINTKDLNISQDVLNSWIHHYIIYKENGGDIWSLKENTVCDSYDEDF